MDDWILYEMDGMRANNSRGLCFGRFYDRSGKLIVTISQEGLIRISPLPQIPDSENEGNDNETKNGSSKESPKVSSKL